MSFMDWIGRLLGRDGICAPPLRYRDENDRRADDPARRCGTCDCFDSFPDDDDEPGEASGYCGNIYPNSQHRHYGGRWVYEGMVCDLWEQRKEPRP